MKDSLQVLLNEFPYFFDKNATSNFYKSQSVTNAQFKRMYQTIFDVVQSFKLQKNCLIWKEQSRPYDYTINFVANFDYLKSVTIYKNNIEIYNESFEYEDEINSFNYSYEDSTLNDIIDGEVADIIPQHSFKMKVETFEEFEITKGFPENDTINNDEFDHDLSLDEIGALHNIPRKEYLSVTEELYPATEPPYNDRNSEDDYHYMQRILNYLLMYHITPLPILEIWKLYGINATLENRERLLLKVFDLEKHPNFIDENSDGDKWFSGTYDEETNEIIPWTPEIWEHQDKFCDYDDKLGKYFFVKVSTNIPVKNQPVVLSFRFMNSLAQDLPGEHTVKIRLGNQLITTTTDSQFTLTSNMIPQDQDNLFVITGYDNNNEIIGTEEVLISVRGCNSADYYVSPTGSDSNDGKTRSNAFKTIQKAVNAVNGDKNLIAILTGSYEITNPIVLNQSCTIMGCGSVLIENINEDLFFKIPANKNLILQDLTLQYRGDICEVTDTSFNNNNGNNSYADVLILFTNAPILVMTLLNLTSMSSTFTFGSAVNVAGTLKDKYGNALSGKSITVTSENTSQTLTTNNNGVINTVITPTSRKDLTISARFPGDENHKPSSSTITVQVLIRLAELLADYDYVVMDMEYVNGEWKYENKPVSEITKLSDLTGAIMNLTYEDMEVTYNRFSSYSTSTALSRTQINSLKGLLVGLAYENGDVLYREISILLTTKLTLSVNSSEVLVNDPITFSGKLVDKYNEEIANAIVIVNNARYTTNENGEFSGSITPVIEGEVNLTAIYSGDVDYTPSTSSTVNVNVLVSLASVLANYDYVVMDMIYADNEWQYQTKPVSEITKLSDLNNAIQNLNKYNDNIQYDRFSSSSTAENITKSEKQSLSGLLVGIAYDDYTVEYENLKIN